MLRGKSDDGKDLVIARNYITHGFRKRAQELATLELGPRRNIDIARSRYLETQKNRFTSLDRDLMERSEDGAVVLEKPQTTYDRFQKRLMLARLRSLQKMNLAMREDGEWRLSPDLETTLKELGRRGDIIRSMGAALGSDISFSNLREFDSENSPDLLIGRVAGSGAIDDAHDKRFLAIDGAEGNQWHVAVDIEPGAMPSKGAIVEVAAKQAGPRSSDKAIAAIAAQNAGVYSDELHKEFDPSAREEFRLAHKRRLEALRRAGLVERFDDGSWRIPEDFLERVSNYESSRRAARVRVLSWAGIDRLTDARGATFLDDVLEGKEEIQTVGIRFGADVDSAIAARRRWLLRKNLANESGERLKVDRDQLRQMEHEAMNDAASAISKEIGKEFSPPVEGERIEGKYARPVDLPTGRFALVEKSKEFTLAPWREALERRRGQEISGVMGRGRVSWEFMRQTRGLGR